jgi:hypothetical protein
MWRSGMCSAARECQALQPQPRATLFRDAEGDGLAPQVDEPTHCKRGVGGRVVAARETKSPTSVKRCRAFELPLLGSNQDSPDPEGPL